MDPSSIGRYDVLDRLGGSAMGTVYLCFDRELERRVAVKLLLAEVDTDESRARICRHVRGTAALVHEHIALIFDFGEHDGRFFIAREYVEGESLEGLLRREPTISLAQRLALVEQLCAGLSSAHDAGVLHNHLKPSNLLVSATGRLKIIDFSIGQSTSAPLTASVGLLGAQFYLSPEQLKGEVTDHRSDLFVAGLILYECITLRRAFGGAGRNLFHHVLSQQALPIEQWCPDVDPELVGVVARAVRMDPVDRYQDARSLGTDLRRIRERRLQ